MANINDIEGSTTSFGESVTRGGRLAGYEGAAMHLNTGNSPSGINTNAGEISLNVIGNIDMPTLHARMIDPNVQTTGQAKGPIISPEVVQQGLGSISKAVTDYTDTMNAIKAKNAELVLRQKLFDLYHGNEKTKGYSTTKGIEAVDGFSSFGDAVAKEAQDTLMSLNPAARMRAMESFQDISESYRAKGAVHSTQEKEKIREGQKQAERELIAKEFHAWPPDALGKQVVGEDGVVSYAASDLKRRYFSTYETHEYDQARKGWEAEVINAAERLYINKRGTVDANGVYHVGKGLEEAKVFRDVIGKLELSEDKLGALDKQLFTWENHEMSQSLESNRAAEARQEKFMKRQQNTNEALAFASMYNDGKVMSPADVWRGVAAQRFGESFASSYISAAQKHADGDDAKTDPTRYAELRKALLDSADDNFIGKDGSNYYNVVSTDPGLRGQDKKELINFAISLSKDKNSGLVRSAEKEIDAVIPATRNIYGQRTGQSAVLEIEAQKEYLALSKPKDNESPQEAHNRALKVVRDKYDRENISLSLMPRFFDGSQPKSLDDCNAVKDAIKKAEADGTLSKDAAVIERQQLVEFIIKIKQQEAKKAAKGNVK